jgi:hypothetical protein
MMVTVLLVLMMLPRASRAHSGGTPRLTAAPAGPYFVYAWTDPEPWRVGEAHISLAVTQPASQAADQAAGQIETPVTDVDIAVTLTPLDGAQPPIQVQAAPQSLLNDFYFEAITQLPAPGRWHVAIDVNGAAGHGSTEFELDALPPRTLNWPLLAGAGVALVVLVALMGIWSRRQTATAKHPARQPGRRPDRPRRSPTTQGKELSKQP